MDPTAVTFLGGLVLGLASTLHCGAMCGGISCSALLTLGPQTPRERAVHAILLQVGRVTSYVMLGLVAGVVGDAVLAPDATANYRVMQWVAAVVLMWSGLAMAGMMPRLALLDAGMGRLSDAAARVTRPLRGTPGVAPVALGAIWGFNPCPMVYAAVFSASLAGSALAGVSVMAGFGLGTVPGVLAAGFGIASLKGAAWGRPAQVAAGLFVALAGFASLYVPAATIAGLCLTN